MSSKYNISFTEESEKEQALHLLKPLINAGARVKVVPGKPYNHIYIISKHEP